MRANLVKSLEMWWDDERVRGLRLVFSDGSETPVYGFTTSVHSGSITFGVNPIDTDPHPECITKMWLLASHSGARLAKIHIETSRGQKFEQGPSGTDNAVTIDVGSGLFVGMAGRHGWDIDAVAPIFLASPIAKIAVGNITYTPHPSKTAQGITPVALNEAYCSNPADAPGHIDWDFSSSQTREVTMSHDMTSTTKFGGSVSVEVSGEVFGVGAETDAGFEWSSEQSNTTGSSTSETVEFKWSISGKLKPGEAITCKAIVQRGTLDLHYDATVTVTLKDNTQFMYPESGRFKGVSYSALKTTVETTRLPKQVCPMWLFQYVPTDL
ncbi:hypothetical protein B0H16DRAFT_1331098 [Mycena metata]|uniref:Jacalin-type lectin domain-containing protein n=1 Tax=Mycena metata TaxID=1033252 RepID=A0AAD7HTX0_9AGAR|nr:hypothetical protein B0H16DRAFT_1331098 [Mycena metata]